MLWSLGCTSHVYETHGDLNFQSLLVYMDDILVFGVAVEETTECLEVVFQCLKRVNLKVKPSKCQMYHRTLWYLGHIVSKEGMELDPSKITAITEWVRPNWGSFWDFAVTTDGLYPN